MFLAFVSAILVSNRLRATSYSRYWMFLAFVSAILVSGCANAPEPAAASQDAVYKPVADVRQLMTTIVIPTSDAIFEVGSKPPADEKAWAAVQNAAMTLAESGNLLMIGSRAKAEAAWMDFSRAMIDAGEIAFKAAENKNVDEVLAAGDKIYTTCENCHNQYLDKTEAPK
jgi:hypothetical protein